MAKTIRFKQMMESDEAKNLQKKIKKNRTTVKVDNSILESKFVYLLSKSVS